MKPVIEVKGVSKSYRISHQTAMKADYSTVKDDFAKILKKPFGGNVDEEVETFWALKDVSFEVNQGEIFAIVGQNGSGKSTMLKILSRIVEPTKGEIRMTGRVASLLEVGTGFHPELTGRENIFFNGSMLGMSRQEIKSKFNDIVEFSEVEKFLDTPVKFYSSGMYVRLAFSIAAHLEPEILILDEVLSVGDAAFQKKSLNKITATMEQGTTVLFVSHSIDTVKSLCNRGLFLKRGKVKSVGPIAEVLSDYTGSLPIYSADSKLEGVQIISSEISSADKLMTDSALSADVTFSTSRQLPDCFVNLHIEDSKGQVIIHARTDFAGKNPSFKKGVHKVTVELPRISLNPGSYSAWFRIYAKHKDSISLVDSQRMSIEIKGQKSESMSNIDLPSSWHWVEVN
jgi:lipopolysaccharide transport system ATP-binding protein